jgi:hypothetical protein
MHAVVSKSLFLGLLAGSFVPSNAEADKKWESLLKNSPFGGAPTEEKRTEAPQQFELRGIVVEDGVSWFTFFDTTSQKWATVRKGEEDAFLVVRSYDSEREAVTMEVRGKVTALILKQASSHSFLPTANSGTSLAANQGMGQPGHAAVALASTLPASEIQRIERVTEGIRQRREERRKQASRTQASGS